MDTLLAAYANEADNAATNSPPPPTPAVVAEPAPDLSVPITDQNPEIDHANETKREIETAAAVEAYVNRISATPKADETGGAEREITEMPSPKRQKQPLEREISPAAAKPQKKKKKKRDVWASTSRRGRKKTTNNYNNLVNVANAAAASSQRNLMTTPMPASPDRSDDSPDSKIRLSNVNKGERVELSEDRLTASSVKGYRMARATRGVSQGAWYFEIKVVHLGETGHTRLGWSTAKAELQGPVGFDGNSYGYRDIDGCKVHKAQREEYGEGGYKEGDVLGFYINLADGGSNAKENGSEVVAGSEISFFKNGICQGVAFTDLYGGCYYPAASMYTLPNEPACVVKFNFGPDFECFPEDFGERPAPRPMIEVPYPSYDGRAQNGNPRCKICRLCPVFKVIKEEESHGNNGWLRYNQGTAGQRKSGLVEVELKFDR